MNPTKGSNGSRLSNNMFFVECAILNGIHEFLLQNIENYLKIVLPLTQVTQKGEIFTRTLGATESLERLKQVFTSTPILVNVVVLAKLVI